MQWDVTVYPAKNKIEALDLFGTVALAMGVAHAEMLKLALYAKDEEARQRHLGDAGRNLEAQMKLAQIEMFIHNLPDVKL